MGMNSYCGGEPDKNGDDEMYPEPRTDAHYGGNGNEDEDTGEEECQWHTEPFGEKVRESAISEEGGDKRNAWDEEGEDEEPYW